MKAKDEVKICIVHPMNPLGDRIGGTATFLRGLIKYAPADYHISWVGISSGLAEFPLGKWSRIDVHEKKVDFFPLYYVRDENKRSWIPQALKFVISLYQYKKLLDLAPSALMFHRLECAIPFRYNRNQKYLFIHSSMGDALQLNSEVKWKLCPKLYFFLEKRIIPSMNYIYTVREDVAVKYRRVFSHMAEYIHFVPTWVDIENFRLRAKDDKLVDNLRQQLGFCEGDKILIFVGRLELTKDPFFLFEVFKKVYEREPLAKLLIVGSGSLEIELMSRIQQEKLSLSIKLMGRQSYSQISELLSLSNVFVLCSQYEGMPISVLEALASGIPVVTGDIGEVKRVVKTGFSGEVVHGREPGNFSNAILQVLLNPNQYNAQNCFDSVQDFTAKRVLKIVYETIDASIRQ